MTITSTAPAAAHAPAPACAVPAKRPPTALELIRQADAADHGDTQRLAPLPLQPIAGVLFTAEQRAALEAPLNRANVRQREQGRGSVSYLEGWQVIAEANRIFGFDGWQRQTVFSHCVAQSERRIGRDQKPGWGVTYIARVRVTVGPLVREGTGAGHGIDVDLGQAHESAIKEAETDAMKRALMTFGNPFGLALYDKRQRQVSGNGQQPSQGNGQQPIQRNGHAPGHSQPSHQVGSFTAPSRRSSAQANPIATAFNGPPRNQGQGRNGTRPTTAPAAIARPQPVGSRGRNGTQAGPTRDSSLDPATIAALQERIRALLSPQLAAFSRAFRSAFQVPDSTPSIAGLISEERHRLWVEDFLGRLQSHHRQARSA
jgi:DNA recombination protein Rad52